MAQSWTASGTTEMTLKLYPPDEPLIDMPPEGFLPYPNLRKRNKVAIVGFADSRDEAPYPDNTWDIWGLNSLWECLPRWDLWFEIHDRDIFAWHTNKEIGYGLTREGKPYAEGLAKLGVPIMMTQAYPEIPNSIAYPIDLMAKKYGGCFQGPIGAEGFKYWTNSVSFMIAQAIDYGYPTIGVWGVDMATASEYNSQRPSCEFFLGVAAGLGRKIMLPATCDLLKTRFIYGFEDEKANQFNQKLDKLFNSMNGRFGGAQQQFELSRKQMDQYIGAMECIKEVKKIWG